MGILHFDEIAYLKFNHIIVPTAANSMLAASANIRAKGLPSPIIYTTTAGNPDSPEGAFALSIMQSALPFSEALYDLSGREELLKVIDASAGKRMIHIEYNHTQLGKGEAWYKDATSRGNPSQDTINRDILNIWQPNSDKLVIPQNLITRMRASVREPNFVEISDDFVIRWYVPKSDKESLEFATMPLVMGMDTSEGVGRDFTTFVIMDPKNMSTVATCRCNDSNTIKVAQHVLKLLLMFTGIVYIPERNNTGVGIIDFVIMKLQQLNINPFNRIYNDVVQELGTKGKFSNVNMFDYKNLAGPVRSSFGYRTAGSGGNSRNQLYKVTMMKALEMNAIRVADKFIVNEFCNLTVRNGRIDHPVGCHDDTAIAYLLASFLLFFGKNLKHYGIREDELLSEITDMGSPVAKETKQEQIAINRRVAELRMLIASTSDYTLIQQYQRELNNLQAMVDTTVLEVQPYAVSQMKYEEENQYKFSNSYGLLNSFAQRYNSRRF